MGTADGQDSARDSRFRRSRLNSKVVADAGPQVPEEYLYKVVDALDEVAAETGKTVPQIALNWLLRRPTVSTLIIGARNESS
jgi:aryl-alcohol dehydrogenase-like predicted oxidoreductase